MLTRPDGPRTGLKRDASSDFVPQDSAHILEVRGADDLEREFQGAANPHAGALAVTMDPTGLFGANRTRI